MANQAAKLFTAYLDSKNMTYKVLDEKGAVVRTGWNLDNTKLEIYYFFAENNENVHIEGRNFVKVPKDSIDKMYKLCNEINRKFRWFKFTIDEDRLDMVVEDDAVIQLDSCAEEVFELMIRMTQVVDEAYPQFMKAIYA